MIADYFPQEKRSRANAILTIGKNFGVAFSSISIIFIKKIGWRSAYASIGGLGILGGLLSMALMKNPEKIRKSFESPLLKKVKEEENYDF